MANLPNISLPIRYDRSAKPWVLLHPLGDTFFVRAERIDLRQDGTEDSGHRIREAYLKGAVKFHPKKYLINLP